MCSYGAERRLPGGKVKSFSASPYIWTATEKQPIVARARRCTHPIGNFALHHQHGAAEYRVILRKPMQNRRSDVVRQVADDSWARAATPGQPRRQSRIGEHPARRPSPCPAGIPFAAPRRVPHPVRLRLRDAPPAKSGPVSPHRGPAQSRSPSRRCNPPAASGNSLDGLHIMKKVQGELRLWWRVVDIHDGRQEHRIGVRSGAQSKYRFASGVSLQYFQIKGTPMGVKPRAL